MVEIISNKLKVELTEIICHIAQILKHLKRNFWTSVYLTAWHIIIMQEIVATKVAAKHV